MRNLPLLVLFVVTLGTLNSGAGSAASMKVTTSEAARGLKFAEAHCSGCHAVIPLKISPDPEAPPFESIVNEPGLTSATLKAYLRDSHNFPEIMSFDINPGNIDALAGYMLTLRESD